MKTVLLLTSFVFCTAVACAQPSTKDFAKLSWLEGKWKRTNAKPGRSGMEQWKKVSDTEWRGSGVNMKGTDTVFVGKMKFITKDGMIFFVADVPETKAKSILNSQN